MPYDEDLARKIRTALSGKKGLVEKKMFGGIAFLLNGKMCAGVSSDDIIIRCEPEVTTQLLMKKGARPFDLSGNKPPLGWLLVGPEGWRGKRDFKFWIQTAVAGNKKARGKKK